MEKLDIKQEFEKIADDSGVLGKSSGKIAYGYIRVSTALQAEEGASGLPRQLGHLHEAALRDNLYIPLALLFADDGYSGFEFSERPALTRLRYECRTQRRAHHLVVEEIDRLSRNADWHQGYLLDEFARREITVHFFNEPGSELERYIRGYMAQETMKKEIERMRQGTLYKAMDGRVTASIPAYGYEISDPKDSHYVINDEEARVVRMIYNWLLETRVSSHIISERLNEMGIPCRRGGTWSPGIIRSMLKNEVYKGWYITNRRTYEIVGYSENGKPKRKWRVRPEKEWVWVSVPAIVTEEEWQEALNVLSSNRKYNGRRVSSTSEWLLSGLMECMICGYTYLAKRGGAYVKGVLPPIRYYACGGRNSYPARKSHTACRSPYIRADMIEPIIWGKIRDMILDPDHVFAVLDEEYVTTRMSEFSNQQAFISQKTAQLKKEKARWDAAYARSVLELDDYEVKITKIQEQLSNLASSNASLLREQEKLQHENRLREEIEKRLAGLRGSVNEDLPQKLKRDIVTTLVDKILVNSETGEGIITGAIPPTSFEVHSGCGFSLCYPRRPKAQSTCHKFRTRHPLLLFRESF